MSIWEFVQVVGCVALGVYIGLVMFLITLVATDIVEKNGG